MAKTTKSKAKKVTAKKTAGNGKGATIVELLRRKEGATLADLTKATGWQPHSVRGFLSAQVGKKLGLKLKSTKTRGRPARLSDRVVTRGESSRLLPPGHCWRLLYGHGSPPGMAVSAPRLAHVAPGCRSWPFPTTCPQVGPNAKVS